MLLREGRLELFGPRDDVLKRLSGAQQNASGGRRQMADS
jgi:ABC-type protease/lipase transport system fused ATPase/permease subunit